MCIIGNGTLEIEMDISSAFMLIIVFVFFVLAITMTSYTPPYKKFHNPDEFSGQVPVGYPSYLGAPITLNQTVGAPPSG